MKNYIDVTEGKNNWKRYLSSIILASVFMIIGSIIYGSYHGGGRLK